MTHIKRSTMSRRRKAFEKILIESVDEGLLALGESPRKAIYFHLERSYSLKKHEIPQKLGVFAFGLEEMFGSGAIVIEKVIMEKLYSKLGLKFKDLKLHEFTHCIKVAKNMWKHPNSFSNIHGGMMKW